MNKIAPLIDKLFPQNSSIIFLHAHPDDESFLSAGLLHELSIRGRRCAVIFAAAAAVEGRPQTLTRQNEAGIACKLLGITSIYFLEFCEPKYRGGTASPLVDQAKERVSESILATIQKNHIPPPFILVSYDKNGGYGNLDHKVVHDAGLDFWKNNKISMQPLLEVTINRDNMLRWLDYVREKNDGEFMPKLSYWIKEFGLPTKEITHYYQLTDAQLELKRAALAAHASQVMEDEFPLSLPKGDFKKVFGCEFFRLMD